MKTPSLIAIFFLIGTYPVCAQTPNLPLPDKQQTLQTPPSLTPNWRPTPQISQFPPDPFQAGTPTSSPVAFKTEFEELTKKIRGTMMIQNTPAILIGNQLIREGQTIDLSLFTPKNDKKENKPHLTLNTSTTTPTLNTPKTTFAGLNVKKQTAKFLLGDREINIPLPTARKRLTQIQSTLTKLTHAGTATFVTPNGYFLTAADTVPDPQSDQKVTLKTAYGTFNATILRKNTAYNLALGQTQPSINVSIPIWEPLPLNPQDQGVVLAYPPDTTEKTTHPTPQKLTSTQPNPPWLVGSPVFQDKTPIGVIAQEDTKLTVLDYSTLTELFPEIQAQSSSTSQTPPYIDPQQMIALIRIPDSP